MVTSAATSPLISNPKLKRLLFLFDVNVYADPIVAIIMAHQNQKHLSNNSSLVFSIVPLVVSFC